MDQVHVVRHKVLVEGRSGRAVAKELGIARDTVRKYLREAKPHRKETQPRARPVWEAVRARVEGLLTESRQWTAGKQQLTATRLHELLIHEGQQVGVTLVKEAVAEWKRQRRRRPPNLRGQTPLNRRLDRKHASDAKDGRARSPLVTPPRAEVIACQTTSRS
jgi:transposase